MLPRGLGANTENMESRWWRMVTGGHRDGGYDTRNLRCLKEARGPESSKESAAVRQSFYGGWDHRSGFRIRTELVSGVMRTEDRRTTAGH